LPICSKSSARPCGHCLAADGARDPDGRRKQQWFSGFRTRREAEDGLTTIFGRLQRGETIDPDRTPLAEYLTAWLQSRRGELAPLSVTQYESVLRTHIEPHAIGTTPLGKLRKAHLRAFQRDLEDKGLAPATRNVITQ
jgi:integrase